MRESRFDNPIITTVVVLLFGGCTVDLGKLRAPVLKDSGGSLDWALGTGDGTGKNPDLGPESSVLDAYGGGGGSGGNASAVDVAAGETAMGGMGGFSTTGGTTGRAGLDAEESPAVDVANPDDAALDFHPPIDSWAGGASGTGGMNGTGGSGAIDAPSATGGTIATGGTNATGGTMATGGTTSTGGTATSTATGTGTATSTATGTSTATSTNTGSCAFTTTYEAESLALSCSTAESCSVTTNAADSGGQHVNFRTAATTASGDYQEYTLPSVAAGSYDVDFYYVSGPSRGINQASIDGVKIGATTDEYSPGTVFQVVSHLGSATLTAGGHTIRFTITGKNTSATNFQLTVDKIVLMRTGCASLAFGDVELGTPIGAKSASTIPNRRL